MIIRQDLEKSLHLMSGAWAEQLLRDHGLDVAVHAQESIWHVQVRANEQSLVKDLGQWQVVRDHSNFVRAALAITFDSHAADLVPLESDPPLVIQALNERHDLNLQDMFELCGLPAPKDISTWRAPDESEVPNYATIKGLTHLGSCFVLCHNGMLALAVHAKSHWKGVVHVDNLREVMVDGACTVVSDSDKGQVRARRKSKDIGLSTEDVFALIDTKD